LAYAPYWEHCLGEDKAQVIFELQDGRIIHSHQIHGTLNRLLAVTGDHFVLAKPEERVYAAQEMTAFYASWLHALPKPLLNPPTPHGLSGRWRHISEWLFLAAQVGLPTPKIQLGMDHLALNSNYAQGRLYSEKEIDTMVLVVGSHILNSTGGDTTIPMSIRQSCLQLSHIAKTPLLGLYFTIEEHYKWCFVGATPYPDLRKGGGAVLNALAAELSGQREIEIP
ncbi:MAG: hypothetical protein AAF614_41100, partial [Chloroflexota bacterium]